MSYESRHRVAPRPGAFVTPVLPRPSTGAGVGHDPRTLARAHAARRHLATMGRAQPARRRHLAGCGSLRELGKSFWQPLGPLR